LISSAHCTEVIDKLRSGKYALSFRAPDGVETYAVVESLEKGIVNLKIIGSKLEGKYDAVHSPEHISFDLYEKLEHQRYKIHPITKEELKILLIK
jgi:hypothetical protein